MRVELYERRVCDVECCDSDQLGCEDDKMFLK